MKSVESKTFCIGYWALSDNIKRDLSHYAKLFPATLGMLAGKKVVFFYDEPALLQQVAAIASDHDVQIHPYRIALDELPNRGSSIKVLSATEEYGRRHSDPPPIHKKEKALEHYWKDYEQSGRDTYLDMLSIWLSKVPLVSRVVEENPFDSTHFAWVDASLARFNGHRDFYDVSRVHDCCDKISFYRGKLIKNGKKLVLNASYISGSRCAWKKLDPLFSDQLSLLESEIYPNDEETILDHCHANDPTLFRMINPKRHIMIVRVLTKLGLGAYGWSCY